MSRKNTSGRPESIHHNPPSHPELRVRMALRVLSDPFESFTVFTDRLNPSVAIRLLVLPLLIADC